MIFTSVIRSNHYTHNLESPSDSLSEQNLSLCVFFKYCLHSFGVLADLECLEVSEDERGGVFSTVSCNTC